MGCFQSDDGGQKRGGRKQGQTIGRGLLFIILLMQVQSESGPFQIVHNARSHKGAASRKTSVSIHEKEKHITKNKKMRKMTMNPQSSDYCIVRESEEVCERVEARSLRGEGMEEMEEAQEMEDELGFGRFFQLGSIKIPSSEEMKLENGIWDGLIADRDLADEFRGAENKETGVDWNML